jgi:hypothetical protein
VKAQTRRSDASPSCHTTTHGKAIAAAECPL